MAKPPAPPADARSPYRGGPELLAGYPLRTYPAYLPGLAVSLLLVPVLWYRMALVLDEPRSWIFVGLLLVVPPIASTRVAATRVGGGRGELRIYRDRVEVPRAVGRDPLRIPLADLWVEVLTSTAMIHGVRVERPTAMVLHGDKEKRVLSADLFPAPETIERAALVIQRLQQGLDPEPIGAPPARDAYDEQLDRELDDLD